MTQIETLHFESEGVDIGAQLAVPEQGLGVAGVVCVTGGLSNAADMYSEWQDCLARQGIVSLAFDARGKGASGGVWEDGRMFGPPEQKGNSQFTRVQDTLRALQLLSDMDLFPTKPSVIGTSMGGDVALHVADRTQAQLSGVVLKAPAAYHPRAHARQFGQELRGILHSPRRYPHAVAPNFGMLRRLRLPVLLFFSEGEQVISPDIRACYEAAAQENPQAELVVVGDSSTKHAYFKQADEPALQAKRITIERSAEFILRSARPLDI
jgi:pimeloyl-ACP methyl ester carboxylesterase